ncbi:MJ0042-type zinc finger domain-containing protein [Afipia sp. TerB]
MQITCPHCTTSYAVDPAKFGATGRKVRCARCHEVWQAHAEEAVALVPAGEPAFAGPAAPAAQSLHPAAADWREEDTPHIESPSISAGWDEAGTDAAADQGSKTTEVSGEASPTPPGRWRRRFGRRSGTARPSRGLKSYLPAANLNTACVVMAALVFALVFWRTNIVRLMPQTATFFKAVGLGVNLRGLAFEDIKLTTETVDNKPVLVIEGSIVDTARKSTELPRLRFIVRDARGDDLYAWNAVLERAVLNPGEKAWFKSRLASPPPEGREIIVRFFNRRDVTAGAL